jgi:hypothetical protein
VVGGSKDGYAVAVRRSIGADAAMTTLATGCTFLGMYIYYLRYVLKKLAFKSTRTRRISMFLLALFLEVV